MAENFQPGARVVDVARRHELAPHQLSDWRREARQGSLALPTEAMELSIGIQMGRPPIGAQTFTERCTSYCAPSRYADLDTPASHRSGGQYGLGTAEGWLGVDDPFGLAEWNEPLRE